MDSSKSDSVVVGWELEPELVGGGGLREGIVVVVVVGERSLGVLRRGRCGPCGPCGGRTLVLFEKLGG